MKGALSSPSVVMIRLSPAASAQLWAARGVQEALLALFPKGVAPAPPVRPTDGDPGASPSGEGGGSAQGPMHEAVLAPELLDAFVQQALERGAHPTFGADLLAVALAPDDALAPILRGTLDLPVGSAEERDAVLAWAGALQKVGIVSHAWVPAQRAEQPAYHSDQGYLFPLPEGQLQGSDPEDRPGAGLNLGGLELDSPLPAEVRGSRRGRGAFVCVIERDWYEGIDDLPGQPNIVWGRRSGVEANKKHGTASLSVLAMNPDNSELGGGIAPDAHYLLLAAGDGPNPASPSAASLYQALAYWVLHCWPGDIVLVEEQVLATVIGGASAQIAACVDVDPQLRELLVQLCDKGAVPILPAGNGGVDLSTLSISAPPAAAPINPDRPPGIRVGAISANTGRIWGNSNRGDLVQLCSWGTNAGAIMVDGDGRWDSYSGTSAASAIVAGAAAVAQAMYFAKTGTRLGVHGMLALLKVGGTPPVGSVGPNAPLTPDLGAIRQAIDSGWTWPPAPPPVI